MARDKIVDIVDKELQNECIHNGADGVWPTERSTTEAAAHVVDCCMQYFIDPDTTANMADANPAKVKYMTWTISTVGSTRKGSGAAEAKAKRTQPRPLPLPQAARLALTQYTNTARVSNTILAYLPRIIRNTRSNDLSSLNTKLRLEVGRLYALVPLTYFWKSLLPNSACVQSRRSPLTNRAS